MRPKGVDDAQSVNIPIPPRTYYEAGTQEDSRTALMDKCGQALRPCLGEVPKCKAGARCRLKLSKEGGEFTLARKSAKLS